RIGNCASASAETPSAAGSSCKRASRANGSRSACRHASCQRDAVTGVMACSGVARGAAVIIGGQENKVPAGRGGLSILSGRPPSAAVLPPGVLHGHLWHERRQERDEDPDQQ